jgi:hypothetical protein
MNNQLNAGIFEAEMKVQSRDFTGTRKNSGTVFFGGNLRLDHQSSEN